MDAAKSWSTMRGLRRLWRWARWLGFAIGLPAVWACTSHRLADPTTSTTVIDEHSFRQSVNHKLDILFMVDDSSSMAPLQAKMAAQFPAFMQALVDTGTGQLPDLHAAVVSQSMGGGAWSNVNQCNSGSHPGDDQAKFQQGPGGAGSGTCPMLHSGETYLKSGDGTSANPPNYDGDVGTVFRCMAMLGDQGCGFEAQFEAVYYALAKASDPKDPDNGGFLRDDAILAIVMLTNEDDCSVAPNSLLLDPGVDSATDPTGLGALQSYRCNEFGHLCDGQPPPHGYDFSSMTFNLAPGTFRTASGPGSGGVMLSGCVSEEGMGKTDPLLTAPNGSHDPSMGHLWPTVSNLTTLVLGLKQDPNDILVAAIAAPTTDDAGNSLYRVMAQPNPAANDELDPVVDHSCAQASSTGGDDEYGDPAVRIKQWVDSFGANGVFYPICASDYSKAMAGIAARIHERLGASCVSGNIAPSPADPSRHDCSVSRTVTESGTNNSTTVTLPECNDGAQNAPCYRLTSNSPQCPAGSDTTTLFTICDDPTCAPTMNTSGESKNASISCVVQ